MRKGFGPFKVLDHAAMHRRAGELFAELKSDTRPRDLVRRMSGGQRQAVAIARSLLGDPNVVLLDEPTAALGIVQTRQIIELIRRLRDRGLGVVVISHNLADVFQVADRVAVLRLGRMAAMFEKEGTREEEVVAAITGAEFGREDRSTEEAPL
jgi:simple sugar transport system ATP-binding protein